MKELHKKYDQMQLLYGAKELNSVYGGGKEENADIVLVFMNPTARNIATSKLWKGPKYQWLGTKQIWKFLSSAELFSENLNNKIQSMKPSEWTPEFAEQVYNEVREKSLYITNLAKCTQVDARPLPDSVFKEYLGELIKEIEIVNPKKIVLFGNQVASIVLNEKINVSTSRKNVYKLKTPKKEYTAFAVYYPVGMGYFNVDKAVEDLKYIKQL